MDGSSDSNRRSVGRHGDHGFTLIEILIAIVLVGILSAVAVVGISNLVSKGSNASCAVSADAARAASAVYFTSHLSYPDDFAALTTATGSGTGGIPATLKLPDGVNAVGLVASPSGGAWTLTMTGGTATVAPTFLCSLTPSVTLVGAPMCPATAGWSGAYYAGVVTPTGPPAMCLDATDNDNGSNNGNSFISFKWDSGGPTSPNYPSFQLIDYFSARWTRALDFPAGTYRFTMGSDDGSKLYIDGTLALDSWNDKPYPSPQPTVTVQLSSGSHSIVMDYYERGGLAQATLNWALIAP